MNGLRPQSKNSTFTDNNITQAR